FSAAPLAAICDDTEMLIMNGTFSNAPRPNPKPRREFLARKGRRLAAAATTAAAVLSLALVGCRPEIAKVGVVLPLSGPDAPIGLAARQGLEASFQQLGESDLELEIRDSASDPARAAQELEALLTEGAVAAIGGVTPGEARTLARVAGERERVLLLPSASEASLSADSKWVYRLSASDADAGSAIASFAVRRLKAKTAAMLSADAGHAEALDTGFAPTFKSLGGKVTSSASLAATRDSEGKLSAELRELVAAKPALILLSGDAAWQRRALEDLSKAGHRGHSFGVRHLAHPAAVENLPRRSRVLFAHTGFDPETASEPVQAFLEAFTSAHGDAPEPLTAQVAAEAYDTVQVLALALEDRPPLASEIRRGLRDKVKGYAGASGSKEFDDTGAVTSFPRIYSLAKDGSLRDHGAFLDERDERIAERRRKLQSDLKKLQSSMPSASGGI
ncbi:MAG: ABC transporter substrate-binding protein, partial [Acidobacteriota bacterium]